MRKKKVEEKLVIADDARAIIKHLEGVINTLGKQDASYAELQKLRQAFYIFAHPILRNELGKAVKILESYIAASSDMPYPMVVAFKEKHQHIIDDIKKGIAPIDDELRQREALKQIDILLS